jgi:N-acetylneuraminic acid mutarotase
MKNLIIFFVSCILLLACSDVVDLSQTKDTNISNDALQNVNGVSTLDIGPVNPYVWTKLQVPQMNNYPFNNPDGGNTIVEVNGDVYCIIGSHSEKNYKLNKSTKRWEPTSDAMIQFYGSHQYLFTHGSKLYFGLQYGSTNYFASLETTTGAFQTLASFPGTPVFKFCSFVFNNKGYVLGGYSGANNVVNQFWEYDFTTNQWTNKGGLPGGARAAANAFVLNDKVYFGLGYDYRTFNGQSIKHYKNDWYQFNPATYNGYSAVKADLPEGRAYAKGFIINDKIYVGWGKNNSGNQNDLWEYNPVKNTWAQKTNCPATNGGQNDYRSNLNAFSIGNVGYLVKGDLAEFWRYSNSSIVPVP